jgi:hypothetical protein
MCAFCQNGPAVLTAVPAAGLVIARLRQALTRDRGDEPTVETEAEEQAA